MNLANLKPVKMLNIGIQVFIATARKADDDNILRAVLHLVQGSKSMGSLQSGNDALLTGKKKGRSQGFLVGNADGFGPAALDQMGMQHAMARCPDNPVRRKGNRVQ